MDFTSNGKQGSGYKNCRRMAINMLVHQLRREEVGFEGDVLLRADMRDGLYLSGKGAAVFVDELSAAVDRCV